MLTEQRDDDPGIQSAHSKNNSKGQQQVNNEQRIMSKTKEAIGFKTISNC